MGQLLSLAFFDNYYISKNRGMLVIRKKLVINNILYWEKIVNKDFFWELQLLMKMIVSF